jgi:hypothetical protein
MSEAFGKNVNISWNRNFFPFRIIKNLGGREIEKALIYTFDMLFIQAQQLRTIIKKMIAHNGFSASPTAPCTRALDYSVHVQA